MNISPSLTAGNPITWKNNKHKITIAPAQGGRIISWQYKDYGELIKQQQGLDGGILRVLLSPERYPGTSYVAPHLVLSSVLHDKGFTLHLRHAWNLSNIFAKVLEWQDKANPSYLDGIIMDKIIDFNATKSVIIIKLIFSNLSSTPKWIGPWLHNHFYGWVDKSFVVINGKKERFLWLNQYWGGHTAPAKGTMRLVISDKKENLFCTLGSDVSWLAGMAAYTKEDFGPQSTDGCLELRGKSILLKAGHSLICNAFIALTESKKSWRRWASKSPVPLFYRIQKQIPRWTPQQVVPLLEKWALPTEKEKGIMILSCTDKLPFSDKTRYSANNCFSHFYKSKHGFHSSFVWLYALKNVSNTKLISKLPPKWSISHIMHNIRQGTLLKMEISCHPKLLREMRNAITLTENGKNLIVLDIRPFEIGQKKFLYQVKQPPFYFAERFAKERSCFYGNSIAEFKEWQKKAQERFRKWMEDSIKAVVPLSSRVTERQEGPKCIREKVVVRSEYDMWVPLYAVKPKRLENTDELPVVLFLCGSGPGKSDMVPDETEEMHSRRNDKKWPSPYAIANRLGCIVICPDHRGWGELAEGNLNQQPGRVFSAGFNIVAMDVWDHYRVVDYAASRPDTNPNFIFSMGSSGGGYMTRFLFAANDKVKGGIISSSPPLAEDIPDDFFFKTEPQTMPVIHPPSSMPIATAAMVQMGAPKPVWIMDGLWDRCALPALPVTEKEKQLIFKKWHSDCNAARKIIENTYKLVGARHCFKSSWFDGDHLAGYHYLNIRKWLLTYWPAAFKYKMEE